MFLGTMLDPARLTTALADRYTLVRELGAGGMATVYLAEDLKHDRKVAVKVLKPELAAVLGAERFVVEIKTTAALQHPHILPLFDSGTADGFLYYVMPFIDGETLRTKLDRETQLGIAEAVKITTDVADALDYAHRHGVIHRDIKPENILLHDGRPMVADFGIALAVSAAAGGRMTETGLSLGTPHYMSPEQATAEKEITARSDVYSLASVLFEMLAGEPPHMGNSAQQIIMKIIAEPVQNVTKLRKAVPPNVAAAVAKALEKLPADRFASAKAFSEALQDPGFARAGMEAGGGERSRAPRRIIWIPTGVALVMAAGVALLLTRGSRVGPEKPMRFLLARLPPGADDRGLRISRDGRLVIYVATSEGVRRVYRRLLADMKPEPLPGTEGAVEAALSPDGRSVAVVGGDDRLRIVPVDGGQSRTVIQTTVPAGISWSARHGLVLGMPVFSPKTSGLILVPKTGDTALTVLTRPDSATMHHSPLVLDDGETVLYLVIPVDRKLPRPWLLGVGTISSKHWTTTKLSVDGIVGVADDVLVYMDGGVMMGIRFDRKSRRPVGEPVRIDDVPEGVREAAISENGTLVMRVQSDRYQIALVNERGEGQVLLPDTISFLIPRIGPGGKRAALIAPLRGPRRAWVLSFADKSLTELGFGRESGLDWTLDGRRVACSALGSVIWQAADASDSVRELQHFGDTPLFGLTLSPDGSAMVVVSGYRSGGFNLLLRHSKGDTATVPLLATSGNKYAARFSPNGRWLAYTSDESGRAEVYVRAFPVRGERIQISSDGGSQPTWSGDSRRIFYRTGRAFMAADLSATAPAAPLTVGAPRKLFEGSFFGSSATSASATYDVTPDGRSFLVARAISSVDGEIIAWTGWLPELKARLGEARP